MLLVLTSILASAQYDTLLNRSFNDRYPALLTLLDKYPKASDSVGLGAEFKALEAVAVSMDDRKLRAEIKAVEFKRVLSQKTTTRPMAEAAFRKALELAQKPGYAPVWATLQFYLADYYWAANDYTAGIQHFEKAYEIAEKLSSNDYFLKQEIAFQLGLKYYHLTDFNTAIYYLNNSLKSPNALDSIKSQISIYNTLGLSFLKQMKLDSSEINFNKALYWANRAGAKNWIGNLSGNLGHVYILKGDLDKGEAFLIKDKEISLKLGAKGSASGAMLELADLNFRKGRIQVAEELLDSAITLMKANFPFHRKKTLFTLMGKMNAYKGRWQEAALYIDSSLLVMDSVSRLNNVVQVLRLKQLVELQQSRAEIAEIDAANRKKNMLLYVMVAALVFAIIGGALVYRQKKKADQAKKRSDELLLNILPKEVAEELKATGTSKARKFTETSVLFCDFKNFTQYSEALDPVELVRILDAYFKAFDHVVTALGLEKIKTVGDAYICIAGLPVADSQHAEKVVLCGLKFQEIMANNPAGWQLRIGIHSGSVVAGIVGIKKFAYEIWGDTVNTAARMEQNSKAGKVNISQATYELVKSKFECVHRGKVEAKHKGVLDMYYVEGLA